MAGWFPCRLRACLLVWISLPLGTVVRGDCNRNGVDDLDDIENGTSEDCNGNGVPDECDVVARAEFERLADLEVGPRFLAYTLIDLDADGDLDLVTVFLTGEQAVVELRMHASRGDGTFETSAFLARVEIPVFRVSRASIIASDLDGDDDVDFVIRGGGSSASGALVVLFNRGNGTFAPGGEYAQNAQSMTAADLDGDGDTDLAVPVARTSTAPQYLGVLLNNGRGVFAFSTRILIGTTVRRVAPIDFDADGDVDLVVHSSPTNPVLFQEVVVLINDGNAVFESQAAINFDTRNLEEIIASDFDGDGDMDLAAADERVGVRLLLNDQGRFLFEATFPVVAKPTSLAAADIDGDGDLDLAVTSRADEESDGFLSILWNDGAAFFSEAAVFGTGVDPGSLIAADLDGDIAPDLLAWNLGAESLSLYLNRIEPPASPDENSNAIPDECEDLARPFHRGDTDDNGAVNISDAVVVLRYLFLGRAAAGCFETADSNNDGKVNLSDGVHILNYLFRGGPAPAEPGPPGLGPCGSDPDPTGGPGDLGCEDYASCDP